MSPSKKKYSRTNPPKKYKLPYEKYKDLIEQQNLEEDMRKKKEEAMNYINNRANWHLF